MRRYRVLLDANVLVDAQLRDVFLTMAEAELIDVRWSRPIIGEARRALVDRLGLAEGTVARLFDTLTAAFPGSEVVGFEAWSRHSTCLTRTTAMSSPLRLPVSVTF